MKKRTAGILATGALALGLLTAPATIAPEETTESASAAVYLCGIQPKPGIYRVKLSHEFTYHYFDWYTDAYNYLHGPNWWTGTIHMWQYDYRYCTGGWQFKHSDYTRNY